MQRLHAETQSADALHVDLVTACTALHFELLLKLEHWQDAIILLENVTAQPAPFFTLLQKLADLTCASDRCPAEVSVIAIEAVMNAAAREQVLDT